jgi:hypothetical protein
VDVLSSVFIKYQERTRDHKVENTPRALHYLYFASLGLKKEQQAGFFATN